MNYSCQINVAEMEKVQNKVAKDRKTQVKYTSIKTILKCSSCANVHSYSPPLGKTVKNVFFITAWSHQR